MNREADGSLAFTLSFAVIASSILVPIAKTEASVSFVGAVPQIVATPFALQPEQQSKQPKQSKRQTLESKFILSFAVALAGSQPQDELIRRHGNE